MSSLAIVQSPASLEDWTIDYSNDLGSDTISTSAWSVNDASVTLSSSTKTNTTATIWVTGGVGGQEYVLTNTITTAGGRTFVQEVPYICLAQDFITS